MEKRIGKAHESVDAAGVAGLVAAVWGGVVGAQFQRQRLDQQSAETAHRPVAAIVNHSSVLPDAKKKREAPRSLEFTAISFLFF